MVRLSLAATGRCLGLLAGLAAATVCAEPLSLRQAVEAALNQNPEMAISQARTQQAEAAVRQAEGARLPSLNASMQATRTNDALGGFGLKLGQRAVGAADFDPARINHPGDVNNLNTRIEVQVPIYTGGLIDSRIEQARAQAVAARQGDASARQQLTQGVIETYQDVHTARARIRLAEAAKSAAEETLRVTERLKAEGIAIKSDVLSARVHLEQAKLGLAQARRLEAGAVDRLRILTGHPLDAPLDVGPEAIPALPDGTAETLRQQALTEHPGLKALRSQLESARARVDGARAGRRPQLNLMGRQDWNDANWGFDASSYTVGGVLSWRFYDGGVTGGAVDQAQAEFHEAAARLRQAENEVALGVADARRRALEAEARIAAQEAAVAQAEEAQRLVRKRYESGVTNLVEVMNGQAQLDRARADLVASRQELAAARAGLRRAIGTLTVDEL